MENITIDATLISEENEHHITTYGTIKDNVIMYNEDDILVTITISDNKINLTRKHPEYFVSLNFSKNNKMIGEYLIEAAKGRFETVTETNELIINNQEIEIIYDLSIDGNNQGKYTYVLKYEVK